MPPQQIPDDDVGAAVVPSHLGHGPAGQVELDGFRALVRRQRLIAPSDAVVFKDLENSALAEVVSAHERCTWCAGLVVADQLGYGFWSDALLGVVNPWEWPRQSTIRGEVPNMGRRGSFE